MKLFSRRQLSYNDHYKYRRSLKANRFIADEDEQPEPEKKFSDSSKMLGETLLKKSPCDDAFFIYGPGIVSYFKLQINLIRVFAWLSVLALIQMIIFKRQGGLDYVQESLSILSSFSFGNMGFSSSQCSKALVSWNSDVRMRIQCQKSTFIDQVFDAGIILSSAFDNGVDSAHSTCSLSDSVRSDADHSWMNDKFNRTLFEIKLVKDCRGLADCTPVFKMNDFLP